MECISVYALMDFSKWKKQKKKKNNNKEEELLICCYSPYTLTTGRPQAKETTDCSGEKTTIYEKELVKPGSSTVFWPWSLSGV